MDTARCFRFCHKLYHFSLKPEACRLSFHLGKELSRTRPCCETTGWSACCARTSHLVFSSCLEEYHENTENYRARVSEVPERSRLGRVSANTPDTLSDPLLEQVIRTHAHASPPIALCDSVVSRAAQMEPRWQKAGFPPQSLVFAFRKSLSNNHAVQFGSNSTPLTSRRDETFPGLMRGACAARRW